ncbi:MAG: hypothetical protein ACJ74Z_22240 [Bryobacteraceae bacterium]
MKKEFKYKTGETVKLNAWGARVNGISFGNQGVVALASREYNRESSKYENIYQVNTGKRFVAWHEAAIETA